MGRDLDKPPQKARQSKRSEVVVDKRWGFLDLSCLSSEDIPPQIRVATCRNWQTREYGSTLQYMESKSSCALSSLVVASSILHVPSVLVVADLTMPFSCWWKLPVEGARWRNRWYLGSSSSPRDGVASLLIRATRFLSPETLNEAPPQSSLTPEQWYCKPAIASLQRRPPVLFNVGVSDRPAP